MDEPPATRMDPRRILTALRDCFRRRIYWQAAKQAFKRLHQHFDESFYNYAERLQRAARDAFSVTDVQGRLDAILNRFH